MAKENIPFSISNYMLSLILPKCAMVYGQKITSIYFQIAININKKKYINKQWLNDASWIYYDTISNNTGYNERTIKKMTNVMQKLDLIKCVKRGKFNIFYLKNSNLKGDNIYKFNKFIDNELLKESGDNRERCRHLFDKLESQLCCKRNIDGEFIFYDTNVLRNLVNVCESLYKGSTFFFIKNIAQYFNSNIDVGYVEMDHVSEQIRSLHIGSSQSTISRCIKSFVSADMLKYSDINRANEPTKILVNCFYKKNRKVVKNCMSNREVLYCPICKREFNSKRALSIHISRTNDSNHKLLSKLRKNNTNMSVHNIYENNLDKFTKNNNYLDNSNNCKVGFNKLSGEKKHKEGEVITIARSEENRINIPELVKYFYTLTGGQSPSFGKEIGQIKSLLNHGFCADDIKTTMDYLYRKGNIDLRFLNRTINEAILEKQYLDQTNIDGTAPFLVKMYYDGLGLPLNMQTFYRDVQKIQETLNNGISYDQTKIVIKYMVDIKCPTINFIGSKITEALIRDNNKLSIKNNPSFYDRDDLEIIKSELINGRTNLRKINSKFQEQAYEMAKAILENNEFSNKYTAFEWAWKIGLNLNGKLYSIAMQYQQNKELALDRILSDPNVPQKKKDMILKLKVKFENWLNKQKIAYVNEQKYTN